MAVALTFVGGVALGVGRPRPILVEPPPLPTPADPVPPRDGWWPRITATPGEVAPAETTAPSPTSAPPPAPTTTEKPPPPPEPEPEPEPPPAATCPDEGFGGVRPHVAQVAYAVAARFDFPLDRILGVGDRPQNPSSDHPKGLALDFMTYTDKALGDRIAAYLVENADRFAVEYVIFNSRIWSDPGRGWRPYSGYHPHDDHVHLSVGAAPPDGPITC